MNQALSLTSRGPSRVIVSLSQRLVCLALLASTASLFGYVGRASAQLPITRQEPEPAPVAPEPAPAAPEPAPVTPAPSSPLPPAPAAPPGVSAPPAAPGASAPAPAKTEVITEPAARRDAEARTDQEADTDEADELSSRPQWYGWQTLIVDGASLTSLVLGASLDRYAGGGSVARDSATWMGLLGYEFGPGIVHFVHRNPGRGFASFGLRLGMPLAGAFLGASLASGCNANLCEAGGAGIGALLGMGGAMAIDAAVFAYDDAKRSSGRRVGFLPLVSVTPRQAWVGIGGQL